MNLKHEITGEIRHIGEVETFASGFSKRLIVITDPADKYPQEIPIEAMGDMIERVGKLAVGQTVDAAFWLQGRAWKDRWFMSAKLAYIKAVESDGGQSEPAPDVQGGESDENFAF